MSELEDLVPELTLCEQIPERCFENTALVWNSDYEEWFVCERGTADPEIAIPAPTLEEIMIDLERSHIKRDPKQHIAFLHNCFHCSVTTAKGEKHLHSYKASDGMLELWLELNKEGDKK